MRSSLILSVWIAGLATLQAAAAEPTREQIDFFERKIRPVLVEHCYRCHSTKARRLKAKLLLDTREGIRKGGESGPAVVPGNVRKSLLIRALRFENDLEMPPKGKLPKAVVDDFVKWVAMGAPDPRRDKATTATDDAIDFKEARKHWAYQPIRRPAVPKVQDADSAIDAFVLARLNKSGLNVSEPADRRTLIRRAYFDLIGMPPTFSEVDEFVSDRRPDAFARVLDRLLASPHYGERWGRHWLDVARYADTKDIVLVFGKDRIRPYAYTYRDYVVRAFNEDVPYDRFIHEQIAVDQLSAPVEKWKLGAMGFLTLGRLYANSLPDIYDDQIDTITRGLLGLTVSCARCHDHKYDAIPTADYYSLYGIFASCEKPVRRPLVERPRRTPEYLAFNKKLEAKHAELQRHIDRQYKQITEQARSQVTEYLLEFATDKPGPLPEASFFQSLSPNDLRPRIQ